MKLAASASILVSIFFAQTGRASAQPGITEPAPAPAPGSAAQPAPSPVPAPVYTPPPAPVYVQPPAPVYAQPPTYAPPPPAEPRPVPQGDQLSEGTALALSLGGTIASYGLVYAGVQLSTSSESANLLVTAGSLSAFFAPSFGHWYAGKFATRGLGMRAGGGVIAVIGVAVALSQCPLFSEEPCDGTEGALIALGGVGLYIAGVVDDIVTAPRRVREHNARVSGVVVAPMVTGRSAGFALGGRF